MKKFLVLLATLTLMFSVATGQNIANDASRAAVYHTTYGNSAAQLVKNALDDGGDLEVQLKRRAITQELGVTDSDSTWVNIFTVPAGNTFILKTATIQSRLEPDMNGAVKVIQMGVLYYDASAATLDTVVAQFDIDADSIAYANVALALTRIDSIFGAGDIIWSMVYADSSIVANSYEGFGITLNGLLDE